jgi:apolipoprotein N-acyltransferase
MTTLNILTNQQSLLKAYITKNTMHRRVSWLPMPVSKIFKSFFVSNYHAAPPLVVDLDGTLIRTDMMWESLARLLRRNPLAIFQILFWWTRGRANLKQKLAARVQVDAGTLPYHVKFLAWLRTEKISGRKIILATASDLKLAQPVAAHVRLFDEVLASDGKTNLRSENKLRALTQKFGDRGFDYAGNSSADFAVWRGSRQAIVVNASARVLAEAARCATLGPTFCEGYSPFTIAKSVGTELFWRSGYLIALVAGLLLALAFPKFGCAGFAWICPALLLFAARRKTGADAFRAGCVGGLAFWLTSLYWLLFMPVRGFPILGWLALAAYLALFFGAWTWIISSFKFPTSSWFARMRWTLIGAAVWVTLEWLRGWLLSGFPWSFLGASQYQIVPLIQIAAFTGLLGVSFLVAWSSLAVYSAAEMIYHHPAKRHVWQAEIVLPMITVVFVFVGGMFRMNHSVPTENILRVVAVQPSIPQTLIWSPSEDEKRFSQLLANSQQAMTNRPDLLLWPESAVPMFDGVYRLISRFAQSNHVAIIFNGDDAEFQPDATNYFNSAFFIQPDGNCAGVYHKQNLVIFGEYVPFARWLPFLKYLTPIEGGWTPGDKPVIFSGDNFSAAPLVCFEDVFSGTARAAAVREPDFLVNLSNDGWFSESAEQWQHLANAVFRAVENDLPLVRCSNNGVTGWVDAHGRVREILRDESGSEYAAGALVMEIPLRVATEKPAPTFYQRHGEWLGWSCAVITLVALMVSRRENARRKNY